MLVGPHNIPREDGFDITVASETWRFFVATDIKDMETFG